MYICTHNFCGYGEIGRHARLRIWCRKACRFESYYPHKKSEINVSDFFYVIKSTVIFLKKILRTSQSDFKIKITELITKSGSFLC